jgi:cell division septation protein DedD
MESRPSKKFPIEILIALWVIGSVFFFSPAYAGEHKWVLLGEMDSNLWFVDTNSISCGENICWIWIKIISRTSVKKISLEKEEYTKGLYKYNCTWREYQIVETTRYDAHDNVISSTASTETGRKHVVPEPISNALHDIVCKKPGQQKGQQDTEEKYHGKEIEEPQKSIAGIDKAERTEEFVKHSEVNASRLQATSSVPQKIAPPVTTKKAGKGRQKKSAGLQKRPKPMFTVQVGAFQKLSYATSLKTALGKKGYNARVTTSESKEGKLYKVSIGNFSDKKEAKTRCEEIKKKEGIQAFVSSW